MKKIIFILTAIFLVLSCNNKDNHSRETEEKDHDHIEQGTVILNNKQVEALGLKLGKIQKRNLTTVIKANGKLEVPPGNKAEVSALIGGNVKKINVFYGDKVRKGQPLAVLQHPDYITLQEDYAKTIHEVAFLKLEYDRQKELVANEVGAGRDLQKVKSDYQIAKAKLQGLKARLKLLNLSPANVEKGIIKETVAVVSPVNGYVNDVNVKIGTYVDAHDKMFQITDNSMIHADLLVYEKDIHSIKEGQKIHFTVAGRPGDEFNGVIFAVGKEFEPDKKAVHIHAKLNEKYDGLIPGMYISGHIHTDKRVTNTLPEDAIVSEGTKSFVFVLKEIRKNTGQDHKDKTQEEEHNHSEVGDSSYVFKMVEVVPGQKDEGYTEVKFLEELPEDALFVLNVAYYLLADMKKEETEHVH